MDGERCRCMTIQVVNRAPGLPEVIALLPRSTGHLTSMGQQDRAARGIAVHPIMLLRLRSQPFRECLSSLHWH
jgi:hypothetical protein